VTLPGKPYQMRKIIIVSGLFFFLPLPMIAQYIDGRELFSEAEYFFSRDDYQEAAYFYEELLKIFPDNSNFNFKVGECFLSIPGSEVLAIPFLEKALQKIVPRNKYNGRNFEETAAPLHAYFYLGNAYRINNRIADALNVYYKFVNSPYYYGNYNIAIVENEIMSCERAKIIQDSPLDIIEERLGNNLNSSFPEINPVVAQDENAIAYIRKQQLYDALFLSIKSNDIWGEPVNMNPLIGSDGDMYPACFSYDNSELYLVKKSRKNSDIYITRFVDNIWTKAEKIPGRVNSGSDETSAWLSADGSTLYFSSSRRGGRGGLDIYYARKNPEGEWVDIRNAGRTVNSRFDEEFPCLVSNDSVLYFSSRGHFNMGGYDVFYSKRIARGWSLPVNIGYPVNNTGDNAGYVITANGRGIYFSRKNTMEGTTEDIFRITIRNILSDRF